jgi:site-specific recombinase XerC
MAGQMIQRGKVYYLRYTDHHGRRTMKRLATDKRVAEQLARKIEDEQDRIRGKWIDQTDLAYRDHAARPLAGHLDDWHKDMVARRKTAGHADRYRDNASKLIALAMGRTLAELIPGRKGDALERAAKLLADTLGRVHLSDLTSERIQQALATILDGGRSAQTANHYRAAIRAFLRWCFGKGRIRSMPWNGVEAYNVEEDLRHIRRSLTDDELALLIAYAESGPDRWGMTGPLRAMAYRVAAGTGFRAEELRSLTPESFRLGGDRPTIFLKASCTKNRRPADQPIARSLAEILRAWLRDKPPGRSVFSLGHETAKAIMDDLEAIGVPYETDDGVADFHSLRAYYVSALIRSGRSIKEVQQLARHSKPETTLKHYAKVTAHDLHNAVESLPGLAPPARRPETLAATGTDVSHADTLAPFLRPSGLVSVRDHSLPCAITQSDDPETMEGKTLENKASDASVRVSARPGGSVPNVGLEPTRVFSIPVLRREPAESSLGDDAAARGAASYRPMSRHAPGTFQ